MRQLRGGRSDALVGIDAVDVRPNGKGVSRALQNIAGGLANRPSAAIRYVIFTTSAGIEHFQGVPRDSLWVVPHMNGTVWEQIGLPLFARRAKADLLYLLRETGPLSGPRYVLHLTEDSEARWGRGQVRHLKVRGRVIYQRWAEPRALRRATSLLAISAATGDQIARRFSLIPDDIRVVPLGIDEIFLASSSGSNRQIVFHLASDDPRDNSVAVMRAYRHLAQILQDPPPLVVAGNPGSLQEILRREVVDLPSTKISFVGRVSDEELARLYRSALVCVQPATDEGFGLQPLEAMASGSPVVALRAPSVIENVGDAAVFVDSTDPVTISLAIRDLLSDPTRRAEIARRGQRVAATFSWERTVDLLERVIQHDVSRIP